MACTLGAVRDQGAEGAAAEGWRGRSGAGLPAGEKIAELEALRKELNKGGSLKDKHFNWGSVLLGGGVTFSIAGPLNTYLRTGELQGPVLGIASR